jgi:hypothetical protein
MFRRDESKYRSYSWIDYVLLSVVLLANIVLVPLLLPLLPGIGAIEGWFTPACIILCAPLICAYIWQLASVNRALGLNLSILAIVTTALYLIGFKSGDRDTMISGVLGAELVLWTLLRWAISTIIARQRSSSIGENGADKNKP